MSEAIDVLNGLGDSVDALDQLGKDLAEAETELNFAEAEWDERFDAVGETLREEYAAAERKSDPAEHTILAATRRENRTVYQRYRQAKRALEILQLRLQASRARASAQQSQLGALRDELKATESAEYSMARGPQRKAA